MAKQRIGLLAGEGDLPFMLAHAARDAGHDVVVYGFDGLCSRDADVDHKLGLAEVGKLRQLLAADGITGIAFSGRFYRPDTDTLAWDRGALALLPKILKLQIGGDDKAARTVMDIAAGWNLQVVGPADLVPSFVARAGALTRKRPGRSHKADISHGIDVLAGIGPFDIGQALVVHNRRILAVEAAEGTDAMLERIGQLRKTGRLGAKIPTGILVKTAKPGQELRMDMPVVGTNTVRAAADAGLAGIALSAGTVLLAGPDNVRAAADEAELFISGHVVAGQPS